ncbi:MAG: hypothetical protein M2R45_03315 [Verrucomicrobia subdivision 3 bacterium]|nr:hypothetical protein [Limisphaerales bacterium]MCS1415407.1 hypothetical protein [Limisphaerales bacterium]
MNNKPASYATREENKVEEVLREMSSPTRDRPWHWRTVADYLRHTRAESFHKLEVGNPEDPQWHYDHVAWIKETADAMGTPLDAASGDAWIDAKRRHTAETAALHAQVTQHLEEYLLEQHGDAPAVLEEM